MGLFGDPRMKPLLEARPFRMEWARSYGGRYYDTPLNLETGCWPSFGYFQENTAGPRGYDGWTFDYAYELPYRGYHLLAFFQQKFRRTRNVNGYTHETSFRTWFIELWTPPAPTLSVIPNAYGRPYPGPVSFWDRVLKKGPSPDAPAYYTGDLAFDSAVITMAENPDFARDVLTPDVKEWIGRHIIHHSRRPPLHPSEFTLMKHHGTPDGRGLRTGWRTVLVATHFDDGFTRDPGRMFPIVDKMIGFLQRIPPHVWPATPGWPPPA